MGGLRETCGAVSAMVLIAGLKSGTCDPNDIDAKKAFYDRVKAMHSEFQRRHGTVCCKELLNKVSIEPLADPSARTPEYYRARPCVRFVVSAAEILEKALWQETTTQVSAIT